MPLGSPVPERLAVIDVGSAYRDVRGRIAAITAGLSSEEWETPVPHCPDWTVRATVAHLSGIVDDAVNGNMEGVATDPWTAAQVAKRAHMSGPDIIGEWTTYGPIVDARATEAGLALSQLLFDAVNHEHDLRHALAVPGARDSDALWVAAHFVSTRINPQLAEKGVGGIALVVDGLPMTDPAPVELHGSVFDVVRASCSRRSLAQIRRMNWVGDASNHYANLFPFVPPADDIDE